MREDYQIKSRIWLERNGIVLLGEGRVRLLEAIDKYGSLSKAAQSMNMSYKRAWNLVEAMNRASDKLLVASVKGGSGGGSSALTSYARELLEQFQNLQKACWQYMNEQEELLFKSKKP